ncbi:zinc finger MYM-type protein 1-like [Zingiber officinale]|uniref:zinc finger MYM-type protein 1-like n=1 Tax=Zingiber officinale TaxID=94328 RepID=UPI001C4DB6D3|nr:zinc finger MYM-type protein 1-like [Zingiber officinale]
MHRFFKRKVPEPEEQNIENVTVGEFDFSQLQADPGLRIPICSYNDNIRDQVRRIYLQKSTCQPSGYEFPKRKFGVSQFRRFNPSGFKEFGDWLEYSIEKDAAYCLYCYLFKTTKGKQAGGEIFVSEGFTNWKGKDRLNIHVGQHDSEHHKARMNYEALMNQGEHIQSILHKQSKQMRSDYRICLTASIDCIRVLLRQGNSFRGHDETEGSLNQGNFLIQLEFLGAHNKEINDVILKNAPKNCKLTSSDIQKDIVRACATETINVIIKDIGNSLFSILVDESRDVSIKEQMSVVLRYVDSSGHINERFIGIEHVTSTTTLSLKAAIDKMFAKYNLSISNLQLALIAVDKKNLPISNFFRIVGDVVNVVGSSCKRSDLLKEKHSDFLVEALERGEISSGRGLNQETTLQRARDTHWGSHYNSLNSLISMFSAVSDVLE